MSVRALLVLLVAALSSAPARSAEMARSAEIQMPAGRFGTVAVYTPATDPTSLALFVSGDGGWHLGVVSMARALVDQGAVVVGIDIRRYLDSLRAQAASEHCQSPAADFENLSHSVQKQLGLRAYLPPVLVGYSSGATVVYAALAQAPQGTFAGAISMGFCADQDFGGATLCPGAGLEYRPAKHGTLMLEPARRLTDPWIAFQGQADQVCSAAAVDQFAARVAGAQVVRLPKVGHGFSVERNWLPQFRQAYTGVVGRSADPSFMANAAPVAKAQIDDLPLVEVAATHGTGHVAMLLTGDGGWAGLDRELVATLAAHGTSVIALDSLRYFWRKRSPAEAADDVARVLHQYGERWHASEFWLIGYSFGADVLPFIATRLPRDIQSRIAVLALLGPASTASFEIHVADWLPGADRGGLALAPEIAQLGAVPILCVHGAGEKDSPCPALSERLVSSVEIGSGHHFSGDYAALAEQIAAFAQRHGAARRLR